MNYREIYAWCIYLSLAGISWVLDGFTGIIILTVGFIVGDMDISWVDEWFEHRNETGKQSEPKESAKDTDPLPDNVTPLPVKRIRKG